MVAPQTFIRVTDLTLYAPRTTNAVMGCVGPATKGQVNQLNDFTDEGNFVSFHGRPVDRMYAQRGLIRYFRRGNQAKFVRIAGDNLATATLTLYAADGLTPILLLTAASPGSWANNGFLEVAIIHNGTTSYNVQVYQDGVLSDEQFIGLTNGTIETNINNNSERIQVQLAPGAGATFPAQTLNVVTGALDPKAFNGGDDGAFAKSDSTSSTTSGVAGRKFFGKLDSITGSREWENIRTIDAVLAGQQRVYGSVGTAVVPGTFTVRAEVGAASFVEASDDGDLSYAPGGAGFGILTSAGATGYIDYRTGNFGLDITPSASTFFAGGAIDAIWIKGATELVGATVAGLGTYAGNLSRFSLAPGWFNGNKAVITVPIDEVSGDAVLSAVGAASSVATLKTLAGWIVPGTVALTPTHPTDAVPPVIYDDGFGGFTTLPGGAGTAVVGTINYRTGVWAVTTWDPVGAVAFPAVTAAQIEATYDIQIINLGGGAVPGGVNGSKQHLAQPSDAGGDALAADTDPGASRLPLPIQPGTVALTISDVSGSPETLYDSGVGDWLDRPRGDPRATAVTGALDYTTGAWSVTASAAITATASISADYTSTPFRQARRAVRGMGPQFIADTTPNAAGMNLDTPTLANAYNSTNWLDHVTGEFSIELDLVPTGANTFNVRDNGALTAVYMPADILGFGDGTTTVFTGQLSSAPYRRQDDRLVALQTAQASSAGAGDPQVAFGTLGISADADHWTQNVALPSDPDNFLDYRTGATSIQWTGAPALDEAVVVTADDVVIHATARYPGDIENERTIMTEGFYVVVDSDPSLVGTLRCRVFFATTAIESFGQQPDIASLVEAVNDPLNGSDFIRLNSTDEAGFLDIDLTAPQSIGLSGAFTNADVVGAKVGNTYTGLQHFRNHEVVALDWIMIPGQWHAPVITALQTLVERNGRRAIGIVPCPEADEVFETRDFVNAEYNSGPGLPPVPTALVPFPPQVPINSNQLAIFDPWLQYLDNYTNETVIEPPDGDMATLVANTDNVAAPWFPIAGGRRGRVLADAVKYSTELDDRNLVYGQVGARTEVINVIAVQQGRGLQLVGQRTAQRSPTALDRINVRWTVNKIMNDVDNISKDFLFELNDTILWREIKAAIDKVLKPIIERRGLQDAFVLVDGTTTTASDIDNLTVKAKIFIKPARAVEFLEFDIVLTPTGADFSDVSAAG